MSKDYRIMVLQMAADGELADQNINREDELGFLLPTIATLESEGFLTGAIGGVPVNPFAANLVITPSGRDYLDELRARKPAAKFAARAIEILINILVAAVTAVIVSVITNKVLK